MDYSKKKKPNHLFFMALLLAALYLGYCIGTLGDYTITLENLQDLLLFALQHPLPFRTTDLTRPALIGIVVVWALGYMYYISSVRNLMPGREYGTSKFIEPNKVNRRLSDKEGRNNKIISQNVRVSLNTRLTGLNNNAVYVGGTGAGKSLNVVKPNIYNFESSIVVTDPKGELLRDTGGVLEREGYAVKVFDLIEMDGFGFNPFVYVRGQEDIDRLITNLMANTTDKTVTSTADPFWEKAEFLFWQSLFNYIWIENPRYGKPANFPEVIALANKAEIKDDGSLSELDRIMFSLDEDHPALVKYRKVMSGAADTKRSILACVFARISKMENPKVLKMLEKDEIDIRSIGEGIYRNPERKTALFLKIPDNDKTYNFIVGMMYTVLFQELEYIADHEYGGELPIHVAFWLEEFPNVALPDSFLTIIATIRSRNLSANILLQGMSQLKTLYKDSWETITGNCDTFVYLGNNEQSTHEYVSKLMGKWTIDKRSQGETLGIRGSTSRNYDVLGRDIP